MDIVNQYSALFQLFANHFLNIYLISFLCIVIPILLWYVKQRPKWKLLALIPGPKAHLIMGNFDYAIHNSKHSDWSQRCFKSFHKLAHKHSNDGMFLLWFGPLHPCVVMTTPENAERVLGNTSLVEKAFIYDLLRIFAGNGLATSKLNRWKHNRKLLNPAFHYRILENFLPIFNGQLKTLMTIIDTKIKQNNGIINDIRPIISMFILDTLCETTMGVKLESQTKCEPPLYLQTLNKLFELALYTIVRPWYWNISISKRTSVGKKFKEYLNILHNFTDDVIKKRKEEISQKVDLNCETTVAEQLQSDNNNKGRQLAFLDLLLSYHFKNPKALNEYSVRSEVDTFMFAGHHTSSSTLTFILHLIGHHPIVQEKIHEELDSLFPYDDDINISLETLREMKYLECVLKESMRLYPPGPLIGRQSTENFQCGKYTIPPGTVIAVLISHIHRLEKYFPHPHSFIPERFLPESEFYLLPKEHHAYAYIPFSAGPRNCIGQKYAMIQLKAVVATILRKYRIKSMNKTEDVVVGVEFVLAPKSKITMHLEPRF